MDVVVPIPRGLSLRAASFILALSLLAQLTYMDHVVAAMTPAPVVDEHVGHSHGQAAGDPANSDHSVHCHEGLASCSEMPLAAGPGQVLFGFELIAGGPPSTSSVILQADARAPRSLALVPPEQPPQSTLAVTL